MFVKTQFETIVDISKFDKIEIEWHYTEESGVVHHIISAVSEKWHTSPESTNGEPVVTSKSVRLAQFQANNEDRARVAYDMIFQALLLGNTALDMTHYAP